MIDFILVYKISKLTTEKQEQKHKRFLESLKKLGLKLEEVDDDVVFVKVYAPDKVLYAYANLFDIDLDCQHFEYRPYIAPPRDFLATPLTNPNINDPIYSRAPKSISGEVSQEITSAERILVLYQILSRAIWGNGRGDYGIHKLINSKTFVDAFPLHDGNYEWTVSGPLNDRQLLALYWGSFHCWHKAQPINLVEKYLGTEFGLYFAWLGYYIKMLIPASVCSILVCIYGLATMTTSMNSVGTEICASKFLMCPKCHYSKCPREKLNNSCIFSQLSYLFDNWCAVLFAVIMSLWATVFMELWQRQESVLSLQWNLRSLEFTRYSLRPQYLEMAVSRRYSSVTNKMEPFIPPSQTCIRLTLTAVTITLLLVIMILATFGVMVYRTAVNLIIVKNSQVNILDSKSGAWVASFTGSILSSIFIFFFQWFYEYLAFVLTNLECHRTQSGYSNAYIFKSYALAFTNNYSALFYIAFFKGKFYTHPGDQPMWERIGGLSTDICDPSGCVVDLNVLLLIIMTFKAITSNFVQVYVPKITGRINKALLKVKHDDLPQWEREYLMAKVDEFFIVKEYMDMVIQYGFVTFFIIGFPLAPLFALINNIIELRVDASKIIKSYRRPIPNKVAGIGAWFAILQAMTYIGVLTNALIIAFTSNFLEKSIYYIHGEQYSFLNQTLSVFNMNDFYIKDQPNVNFTENTCYYAGKRYPPEHDLRLQRRKGFWYLLGIKFGVVVLFEHLVIFVKGFLAYAIPDMPFSVKQQINYQERLHKRLRMKTLNQEYLKHVQDVKRIVEEEKLKVENVMKQAQSWK